MELYQLKRYNTIMKYIYKLILVLVFITGCAHTPSPKLKALSYGNYKEVDFASISSWKDEKFDTALASFVHTCSKTSKMELFKISCEKAKNIFPADNETAQSFFENNFTVFASLSERSLATGYFEPLLQGSLEKSEKYPYPLYGVPSDLLRVELSDNYAKRLKHPLRGRLVRGIVKPYYTRQEINEQGLQAEEPICYVDDKVELFFLQVQGSGCIELEDSSQIFVGYGDQNGYPYVSIGKEMIKRGLIEKKEVSLQSIRNYLHTHPQQMDDILNANPSYIFFEPRSHRASGSLGLVLQAERSVAVDKKNIPLGMPLFVSTTDPLSEERFERMMFAHDTGGAIKGEARIDIFYGAGAQARSKAGAMKNPLKLWLLVPNDYLSMYKEGSL